MAGLFDDVMNTSAQPQKSGLFDDVLSQPPQQAPKDDSGDWIQGGFLPIAHNPKTGETRFSWTGLPKGLADTAMAPGQAISGQLPMQEADPVTGEVHTSMAGIKAGNDLGMLIAPGAEAPLRNDATIATEMGSNVYRPPSEIPSLMTSGELKDSGAANLEASKNSGVTLPRSSFAGTFSQMKDDLSDKGFDDEMHPKAAVAMRRFQDRMGMQDLGGNAQTLVDNIRRTQGDAAADKLAAQLGTNDPIDFDQVHKMRQLLKSVRGSADPQERMYGRMMKDSLDNYVTDLADQYPDAAGAFKQGIDQYARGSRAETIEDLIQDAYDRQKQFNQSGLANAIQTNLRNFVRNDKKMRMFTPDEQDDLRQALNGSFSRNVATYLGKLAPRGVVSGASDILIGHFLSHLVPVMGPIGTMVVGEVARRSADALAERELMNVSEMIRAGGKSNLNAIKAPVATPKPMTPWRQFTPPMSPFSPLVGTGQANNPSPFETQ